MEKEKQKERKLKRVFLQKKYNLLTTVLVALCVALLSGGGVFWLMDRQVKGLESANQAMGKINTVYNALYYNYYKDVSQQKLVDGALNGMVEALGDPFTEYMNKT